MFRWKKRDDGFEWHQYVRTTIKLRREARRDKAQKLGQQAAESATAAGVAAGSLAQRGLHGIVGLAQSAAIVSGRYSAALVRFTGQGLGHTATAIARAIAPVFYVLGRPGISGPLVFAGAIATAAGIARVGLVGAGLDNESIAALTIGLLCLACGLGPGIWLGHSALPSRLAALRTSLGSHARLATALSAVVALAATGWLLSAPVGLKWPAMSGLPSLPFSMAKVTIVEGKAGILAADLVRIGDTTIRLAGLEAPDRDQRCVRTASGNATRTWPCGEEAREALSRLVRAQTLKCEIGPKNATSIATGACRAGTTDIAEALVRSGHAFAEAGLLSQYRSAESEAKAVKAGLWGSGPDPERPAVWRARLWSEAKKQAPEGCPIKGRVTRGERIYVLPWSSEYAKARVSKQRGERWFCSEEEAVAAGWRVAGRG